MHDEYLNKGKVITLGIWSIVVVLLLAGWVTILVSPDHARVAGMLAATACSTSALAAALQIRCYAVRLSCLMRTTAGLRESGLLEGLRPVRD